MSIETFYTLIPEMILIGGATLIYLAGAFFHAPRAWGWLGAGAVLLSAAALYQQYTSQFWIDTASAEPLFTVPLIGPVVSDLFGQYMRWLVLGIGFLLVLMMSGSHAITSHTSEGVGSLLMALAGLMLVAGGRELVLIFMGLELVSIPTYVLLYIGRHDMAAQESATKYFFLSILSSGLLLYGFSFLYGVGGSTSLEAIRTVLATPSPDLASSQFMARVALVLMFAGLGFRITAVPFHFYAADVYEGTSNFNAGFLSVVPKIAGFAAIVRIMTVAMPGLEPFGWRIALILAVLTMTLGNVLALWQNSLRRMLAYSSIAHAGYMLIGLAAGFAATARGSFTGDTAWQAMDGISAILYYLAVYAVAVTGFFAALAYLGGIHKSVSRVDELAGVGRSHPLAAFSLTVFLFSMAGLPPLAGFWGKYTLFRSALAIDAGSDATSSLRIWFVGLAVVGALNAAVAAAYYLRIISVMYFQSAADEEALPRTVGREGAQLSMVLAAVATVLLGCFPGVLAVGSSYASMATRAEAVAAPDQQAVNLKRSQPDIGTETTRVATIPAVVVQP